jgi:DNA-binding MarR family transcriptional regulator
MEARSEDARGRPATAEPEAAGHSRPASDPAPRPAAAKRVKPAAKRTSKAPELAVAGGNVRLGQLTELIGFNLRVSQEASFRAFARRVGQKGLRPGRFAAMMVIHNNPGISQSALSRAIARDKSSVTPLIQDLDRRGLVDRRPSLTDGRSVTLALTAAGEAMLRDLLMHAEEHDRTLDRLVGEGKEDLIRMLHKICDGLK